MGKYEDFDLDVRNMPTAVGVEPHGAVSTFVSGVVVSWGVESVLNGFNGCTTSNCTRQCWTHADSCLCDLNSSEQVSRCRC